jgi:hypothetical protein
LHGAISHFAIRRHLYGASGQMPSEQIIELHVRVFLAGLPVMLGPAPAVNG